MKIKSDFVTNSSSTSYVVYIPEGTAFERLVITDEMKSRIYELVDDSDGGDPTDAETKQGIVELKRIFNTFLKDGSFYDNDSYSIFNMLCELFDENKLVIFKNDTGPDEGSITLFRRLHLDKIEDINRRMS